MNLYQRMTETLAENMGDTLLVNQQFEEAIHHIAELELEPKEVLNKWISVKDRMPDCDKRTLYLVVLNVGSMKPVRKVTTMIYAVHGYKRFLTSDWQKVTHWQEMPGLPG